MSGLEFLKAIMAGRLPGPPFGTVLGTHKTQVEEGRVTFELDPGEHHCNPMGTVHGGAL